LISQLRRTASSIPANIAEGCGWNGNREFARFLEIALRSAGETEYYLLLAQDLKYLGTKTYEELNNQTTEVKRMFAKLIQKLTTDS
jgi:four helix bundle protein